MNSYDTALSRLVGIAVRLRAGVSAVQRANERFWRGCASGRKAEARRLPGRPWQAESEPFSQGVGACRFAGKPTTARAL